MGRFTRTLALALSIAVLAPFALVPAQAEGVAATVIPYLATGYKFKVVSHGSLSGFEQPSFDDSGFSTGDAGFGTPSGFCSLNNQNDVKTTWPLNTDILLRKAFFLPPGTTNLRVGVAIDNDVQVFINGQDISGGLQVHEGCPTRDSFIFGAPDSVLVTGTNLLAVRGRDRGVLAYLDVRVTADLPLEVAIDVKPGSDPNAINCKRLTGVIPVAILSEGGFDATTVDASTVRFGRTGTEAAEAHGMGHLEDVDSDGDLDMVLHFPASDTGIRCGDTEAVLSGKTTDGMAIWGRDAIKTVP